MHDLRTRLLAYSGNTFLRTNGTVVFRRRKNFARFQFLFLNQKLQVVFKRLFGKCSVDCWILKYKTCSQVRTLWICNLLFFRKHFRSSYLLFLVRVNSLPCVLYFLFNFFHQVVDSDSDVRFNKLLSFSFLPLFSPHIYVC